MALIVAAMLAAAWAFAPFTIDDEAIKRLNDSAAVFSDVMQTPDKAIPRDLLDKAHCIVIAPGLKSAAFGVGGKYGKGYLSCRNKGGTGWSAPGAIRIEGGSVGFRLAVRPPT